MIIYDHYIMIRGFKKYFTGMVNIFKKPWIMILFHYNNHDDMTQTILSKRTYILPTAFNWKTLQFSLKIYREHCSNYM